jgi:hypothetical protein
MRAQPCVGFCDGCGDIGHGLGGNHFADQLTPVHVAHDELRARADAVDLPLEASRQIRAALDGVDLELEARRACVDDKNGIGHRVNPLRGLVSVRAAHHGIYQLRIRSA